MTKNTKEIMKLWQNKKQKRIFTIDWWFLSVMPNMIDDLRKTAHGYPSELGVSGANIQAAVTDSNKEAEAIAKWDNILSEMAFLLREANEDTCSKQNPYDAPEYSGLMENYLEQCKELDEYRNECKDKGFDLIKKWFWDLWD